MNHANCLYIQHPGRLPGTAEGGLLSCFSSASRFAVIAATFAVQFRNGLKEHRRIEPIRREVQGHPVTFSAGSGKRSSTRARFRSGKRPGRNGHQAAAPAIFLNWFNHEVGPDSSGDTAD